MELINQLDVFLVSFLFGRIIVMFFIWECFCILYSFISRCYAVSMQNVFHNALSLFKPDSYCTVAFKCGDNCTASLDRDSIVIDKGLDQNF